MGRRSSSCDGPGRRRHTNSMRSSRELDISAPLGHIEAEGASHLRVLPVPGGAEAMIWGADSAGTMTPRLFFTQPANGVGGGLNSGVGVIISLHQLCYLDEPLHAAFRPGDGKTQWCQ